MFKNTNVIAEPTGELSSWSISGISENNTSYIFNKSHSVFNRSNIVKTFERVSLNTYFMYNMYKLIDYGITIMIIMCVVSY